LLKPRLQFFPKNGLVQDVPVEIFAFHPPPFGSEEDERLNHLCPVRALRVYCERTKDRRQSDRLFVSHGKSTKKTDIVKSTLSGWIVEAINLAYDSAKVARPFGLKAHSTRGMASSWGLAKGTSIQEVCLAANWKSPSTFTAYYQLDVAPRSLAQSVLQVAVSSS
jgi:integrase